MAEKLPTVCHQCFNLQTCCYLPVQHRMYRLLRKRRSVVAIHCVWRSCMCLLHCWLSSTMNTWRARRRSRLRNVDRRWRCAACCVLDIQQVHYITPILSYPILLCLIPFYRWGQRHDFWFVSLCMHACICVCPGMGIFRLACSQLLVSPIKCHVNRYILGEFTREPWLASCNLIPTRGWCSLFLLKPDTLPNSNQINHSLSSSLFYP